MFVLWASCLTAQSRLQQAADLARQRHYAEAHKLLEGVAEPDGPQQRIAFHRLKAAIASGLHDPAGAAKEMEAALALSPAEPNLLLAAALAELEAGELQPALSHASAAPESATREVLIGQIQDKRGAYLDAANAYEQAVKLRPDQEQYRIALGLDLIERQSFQLASKALTDAVVLFPKSARIRTLLGIAQYAQGYTDDAMRALEDAIAVDPNEDVAYGALAKIILQSSAVPPKAAIDSLCHWSALVCSAIELRVARQNGDSELMSKAIGSLKQGPANSAVARCELGRAYEWSGRLPQARSEMEACVRLDPSPQNLYRLGLIYRKLALPELAEREMKQRAEILQRMSEQTAAGLSALEGFR